MENQKRINVLQLVDGFRLGGAETKLLEFIKHLDKKKYNVIVCSLLSDGPLLKDFNALGVPVKVFHRKHRFDVRLIPELIKFMREKKIHIVQTTLFYADFLGPITARLAGVPIAISWETVSHAHSFYTPKYRGLAYRFAMKFIDKIVPVSEDVNKSLMVLRKISPSKLRTIHYGVNLEKYNKNSSSSKRRELGLSDKDKVVGVVARLDEIKGHVYLINALPEIKKKHGAVKCLIVGDGESRTTLEKRCQELGLMDDVLFLGFRNDVADIVALLDVFILPSLSEGLPNAILEAMASSVPVVATSVGGIPEVITNDFNGKLIPPKDSLALAQAVCEVLGDEELKHKLSSNGKKFVMDEYSLQKQMQQFQALYDELVTKKMNGCGTQ